MTGFLCLRHPLRGRGRKNRDENEMLDHVNTLLQDHHVSGLLTALILKETQTVHKRAYGQREAHTETVTTVTVNTTRNVMAYANAVRSLGWRVFVCNDLELSLTEAVLAYREEYLIERGFNRFRGKTLGITPLFLSSTTRIKGLIRLLSIALRVLCLVEFTARKALQEQDAKLNTLYAGNPKRATAKPTAEKMLRSFRGISLNVIGFNGVKSGFMTPLNAVQMRILALLGFSPALYQGIELQSGELAVKMSER